MKNSFGESDLSQTPVCCICLNTPNKYFCLTPKPTNTWRYFLVTSLDGFEGGGLSYFSKVEMLFMPT